ncbi:MAG TPA: hypothetical protein VEJ46_00535 [Candidatus Acidoferrum sp.]|nr:hypothetical protein [Candidatus Acidoferrum sp.]
MKVFDWLDVMKIVGAAIAFYIGLRQYQKAQVWKRVEFVASEMKAFDADEAARAAMTMLDWSRKKIELYKYRGLDDHDMVIVDYRLVAESLETDLNKGFDKAQSAIREVFDEFLGFIERFESFLEAGVIEQQDLVPYLHYWTKMLSGNDQNHPELTKIVLPQFWRFVDFFGYRSVIRFVSRYDRISPDLKPGNAKCSEWELAS